MDKTRAASQFDVHRSHRPIHKCQNKNQLQHQQRHQRPDLAGGPQQTTAAHTRGLARFPFLENGSPASSDRACQLSRVRLVPSRPAAVLRATVARSSPGKRSTALASSAGLHCYIAHPSFQLRAGRHSFDLLFPCRQVPRSIAFASYTYACRRRYRPRRLRRLGRLDGGFCCAWRRQNGPRPGLDSGRH